MRTPYELKNSPLLEFAIARTIDIYYPVDMVDAATPEHRAFLQAIELAKGQTALAKICGCTQGNIWQLIQKGSPLPAQYVLKVEAATGISRHDLRPDLYPVEADIIQAPTIAVCTVCSQHLTDITLRSCADTGCPHVGSRDDEFFSQGGTADRGQGAGSSPLSTSQPDAPAPARATRPAGNSKPSRKAA